MKLFQTKHLEIKYLINLREKKIMYSEDFVKKLIEKISGKDVIKIEPQVFLSSEPITKVDNVFYVGHVSTNNTTAELKDFYLGTKFFKLFTNMSNCPIVFDSSNVNCHYEFLGYKVFVQ